MYNIYFTKSIISTVVHLITNVSSMAFFTFMNEKFNHEISYSTQNISMKASGIFKAKIAASITTITFKNIP